MNNTKITRNIGLLAENIAVKYLIKHGFSIVTRNYRAGRGEIDVIAMKSGVLSFFEVKSSSYRSIRPEENVDSRKLMRIRSAMMSYLAGAAGEVGEEADFHFHVIVVHLDHRLGRADVSVISDVIV